MFPCSTYAEAIVAIGHGNDLVCNAIAHIASRVVGKHVEELFAEMGAFWNFCKSEPDPA